MGIVEVVEDEIGQKVEGFSKEEMEHFEDQGKRSNLAARVRNMSNETTEEGDNE